MFRFLPGGDHFQIPIALYWFKLRHKPKHIQKLQQVTNWVRLSRVEYKAFCLENKPTPGPKAGH